MEPIEIKISQDESGNINIQLPDGPSEVAYCIYLLELAKNAAITKTLTPAVEGKSGKKKGLVLPFRPFGGHH